MPHRSVFLVPVAAGLLLIADAATPLPNPLGADRASADAEIEPAIPLTTQNADSPVAGPWPPAVVDRIVDDTAVLLIEEAGSEQHLPVSAFGAGSIADGTWLHATSPWTFVPDPVGSDRRRDALRERQRRLLDRADPERWSPSPPARQGAP